MSILDYFEPCRDVSFPWVKWLYFSVTIVATWLMTSIRIGSVIVYEVSRVYRVVTRSSWEFLHLKWVAANGNVYLSCIWSGIQNSSININRIVKVRISTTRGCSDSVEVPRRYRGLLDHARATYTVRKKCRRRFCSLWNVLLDLYQIRLII